MASNNTASRGVTIFIDGTPVRNSVKGIQQEMRKLINEQANMTVGSDKYIEHAKKIAQLEKLLQEHRDYQREIAREYGNMSGAADDFGKKSKKAFSMDFIKQGINELKGAIIGFIASFTVDKAIDEFAKLDDAQANVQKYTGLTRAKIKELNKDFDSLDTRTATNRLNDLAADAGRLGIQGRRDILDFVDAANIIDVALGEDLGEDAIKAIGKLSQAFGDDKKTGLKQAMLSTGSAINEVAQNSSAAESYLVDFTNRLAGTGVQADIAIPKILGYASVLDQNAQQVEMSATALSGLIMKLYQDPAKFAKMAGLDVSKFTKLLKEDANEALLSLLETLGKKGGLADLAPIFKDMQLDGARASSVISVLAGNIENIRKEQKTATDAFNEGKSVINEYDVQNNTFSANLDKQKKVLLGYITDIGEKLAPMVLEGASAGNMILKVLTSVISVLIDNKGVILTVAGAYIAYNVALKAQIAYQAAYNSVATAARLITLANAGAKAIETGNTVRATAAQRLYYTTMEKGGIVTKAYIAVTSLLSAAKAFLTGNLVAARAAMVQFNTVVAANPVGAFLVVIGGLVAAFGYLYSKTRDIVTAQKAVKDATKEFNGELAKEQNEVNKLFYALKSANPESEEFRKIRDKIIQQYAPYIKNLINEKGELISISLAHQQINDKLREQISLKIKNAATSKIIEKSIEDQQKGVNAVVKNIQKQMSLSDDMANVLQADLNKVISDFTSNDEWEKNRLGLNKRIKDTIDAFSGTKLIDYKYKGGLFDNILNLEIESLTSRLTSAGQEVKKVENQFKGIISDATELDSLLSGGGGTGDNKPKLPDGDPVKGDKASTQRKKMQDALKKLEEDNYKDMAKIKQDYLNGDILTEEAYNNKILEQQDKYDEDRKKKLQELLKSISDPSLRLDIAKQIADIEAKALDRQIAAKAKKQKDAVKQEQDLLKWNAEETKKILESAFKYVATEEDKAYIKQMERRANGEISEAEYQKAITDIQMKYLEERLRLNGASEEQIADIRRQILEQEINTLQDNEGRRNALLGGLGTQLADKMKEIDDALLNGAITFGEAVMLRVEAYMNTANSAMQDITNNLSNTWSNYASVEESQISRKYDKEIAAAEGNSKKQKKLEEKKQKELNAIKAKYADKQFAVTVAQTISSTALAAMEAYKAMAGIPVVGPALAIAAAGAAVAYGASQIAVAKEQRDAAKEGYYKGGYYIDEGYTGGNDPRQVRGFLPDGSPVHGGEFIANHTTTSLYGSLFDVFDEAQRHNTVSSISKGELAKALNIPTGYYQGGYNGQKSSATTVVRDNRNDELYERVIDVLERLDGKMDKEFKAYVTYKGEGGIEEAEKLDKKMMKNV
jgi:TP901 family phage tail tape measure protein